jgi:heme oxygenase (biliverdin-producing, ferredoxin)
MSIVLSRVAESKKRIPAEVLSELDSRPLSKIMRRQTWPDHERAEFSPFEQALVKGTISKEAYVDLLVNVLPVYEALEARIPELADDPIAGPLLVEGLERVPSITADLNFYSTDWQSKTPLPVTDEYVNRIKEAVPERFVAHHYTRYMADLSGGFYIDKALTAAWNLEGLNGRAYYAFAEIPDANTFKDAYRAALDSMPVNAKQKEDMIEEVLVAYEYNIEMVSVLADQHGITA